MKSPRNTLLIAAATALLGVGVVTLGEWLMLYSPTGGYGMAAGHQNFLYSSPLRLTWGFFLAVLAAPVYALAYYVIGRALQLSTKWLTVLVGLAIFGFSVGNVWLGTNAYIGFLVQAQAAGAEVATSIDFINRLSDPLLQVVRVVVLSLSLVIIATIVRGDTYYPRWTAIVTPVVGVLSIFVLYSVAPSLGNYLLPAALNIAHVVFLIITLWYVYKKTHSAV